MKRKTSLPPDFTISHRVKVWSQLRGYDRLEEHLEYFILKCEACGYQYVNWDSAIMTAIRDDWAKLRVKPRPTYSQNVIERGKQAGIEPKVGESMQEYERRLRDARH